MTSLDFKDRLGEFFYYPKLSNEEDSVDDRKTFTSFLDREPDDRPVYIYIHLPFCDYLCHFCPLFKTLNQMTPYQTKKRFFDALIAEIYHYGECNFLRGRAVAWVEFGGGTPTSVEPEFLDAVLTALHDAFDLSRCQVMTMEGEALTLQDSAKLALLRGHGVNRVSYGVQTFKEDLRRRLGLKPTIADVRRAADAVRAAGMSEIAIDLLYNLPDQSQKTLRDDLASAFALRPDYIDVYSLTLWENTRFKAMVEGSDRFTALPSNDQSISMFEMLRTVMRDNGYDALHSFTFATAGPRHPYIDGIKRHLLAGGHAIGIGPSSRGFVADHQYINTTSLEDYMSAIEGGLLPVSLGARCTTEEKARRIMVMFPVLLQEIRLSDIPQREIFAEDIDRLIAGGYLREQDGWLRTTDLGMTWAGNISRAFFSTDQKAKMTRSYLFSMRERLNPYNQDHAGISRWPLDGKG